MSIRVGATTSYLIRTADLPTYTGSTVMAWVNLRASTANGVFWAFGEASDTWSHVLRLQPNGTTLEMASRSGDSPGGTSMPVGVWTHLCWVMDGTGAGQWRLYKNGVLDITYQVNASTFRDEFRLGQGNNAATTQATADFAHWICFDRALRPEEIQAQMEELEPLWDGDLNWWLPSTGNTRIGEDRGWRTRNWTVTGTVIPGATEQLPRNTRRRLPAYLPRIYPRQFAFGTLPGTLPGVFPSEPPPGFDETATAGAIVVSGSTPTLNGGFEGAVTAGAIAVNGTTPTIQLGHVLAPTPGAVAVTGETPSLLAGGVDLNATAGAITVNGTQPNLQAGAFDVVATPGAITVSGTQPVLTNGQNLVATSGAITISGTVPTRTTGDAQGVLANDTDADLDPLTAIVVANPTRGSLTLYPNGAFVYTPNTGFIGQDSFTYKANDGTSDSNVATVTISVEGPFVGNAVSGPITITGQTPVVTAGTAFNGNATPGAITVSGTQPAIEFGLNLAATAGAVLVNGTQPTLFVGDAIDLNATSGSIVVSGSTPTLQNGNSLSVTPALITISGTVPVFGNPTFVPNVAAVFVIPGSSRTWIIPLDDTDMSKLAPQTLVKDPAEIRLYDFDFAADLGSADLTGTPTIVEVGSSALGLDFKTTSGKKAQVRISGGVSGVMYTLKATALDNSTPPQTLVGRGRLLVEG